jgi:hypothetical protein
MGWAGHIARFGVVRSAWKILVDNLKGRCDLEDIGTNARLILKFI